MSLLLAAPVATWGAWPLHRAAWYGLGHGAATMDTLVSLGIAASFGWSVYALLFGGAGMTGMKMSFAFTFGQASGQTLYLEAAAGVTVAVLAGRYPEARARDRSGSALTALAALGAKTVAVLRDGAEQRVAVEELAVGDVFVVRPGEKIATNGVVVEGSSAIDTSLVTGESMPAEVAGRPGTGASEHERQAGGARNQVGADTMLAQITRLVSHAQATKASAQRLADRVAAVFVPCVIALAVATLGFWLGTGLPAAAAWSAAVAVLVVACPCALGLATPTALLAAVGRGAERAILVKSAQALESAGRIRRLALDKTGTLTTGTMTLQDVIPAAAVPDAGSGLADDAADHDRAREALRLAGAVEDASEHPVGQAIARAAVASARVRCPRWPVSPPCRAPECAAWSTVTRSPSAARGCSPSCRLPCPPLLWQAVRVAEEAGRTAVLAGGDGQARAVLVVADQLKPHAAEAVARVRGLGSRPGPLTGDNGRAALVGRGPARHPGDRCPRRGPPGRQGRSRPPPAVRGRCGRPGR